MLNRRFEYWLLNYKELTTNQITKVMTQLYETDDFLLLNDYSSISMFAFSNFVSFAKLRQKITNNGIQVIADKKSLELLGEFYQMNESVSFPFKETDESPIITYCQSQKPKNSYVLVLLSKLIHCGASYHVCKVDEIYESFRDFYKARISAGKIAENEKSLFAKPVTDDTTGRLAMLEIALKKLENDEIIACDGDYERVIICSKFKVHDDESEEVLKICNDFLDGYYKELIPQVKNEICKYIKDKISDIEANFIKIQNCSEKQIAIEILHDFYSALTKIPESKFIDQLNKSVDSLPVEQQKVQVDYQQIENVENTGIEKNSRYTLSHSDARPIGELVRQSFQQLEKIGYSFSDQQIINLCSVEWSRKTLKVSYPCFVVRDEKIPLRKQCRDSNGRSRYWVQRFFFNSTEYIITSQWYIDSKPFFIDWFNSILPDDEPMDLVSTEKSDVEDTNMTEEVQIEDTIISDIPCEQIENVNAVLNSMLERKSTFTEPDEDNCMTEIMAQRFIFPELHSSFRNGRIWEGNEETKDENILVYGEDITDESKFDRILNLSLVEYINRYGSIATKFNLDLGDSIKPEEFKEAFMKSLTSRIK